MSARSAWVARVRVTRDVMLDRIIASLRPCCQRLGPGATWAGFGPRNTRGKAMMMRRRAWHGVMVVGTMLLTACSGPSGEQRAMRDLNGRLEARLAPEIALGRASV